MKCIILAAGRGSRLGSLGADRPKCLVELAGRPLLDWQRSALQAAGVTELAIVGGYRHEQLPQQGITKFINPDWADTGIVASLLCARDWLQQEPCLVSYADIIFDADIIRALSEMPGPVSITSYQHWRALWELRFPDPLQDAESFMTDAQGHLTDIGARPNSLDQIEGQYMGLLKFTPTGFSHVLEEVEQEGVSRRLDMTSLLSRLIARGIPISTNSVDGLWYEVDNAEDAALFPQWQARCAIREPESPSFARPDTN